MIYWKWYYMIVIEDRRMLQVSKGRQKHSELLLTVMIRLLRLFLLLYVFRIQIKSSFIVKWPSDSLTINLTRTLPLYDKYIPYFRRCCTFQEMNRNPLENSKQINGHICWRNTGSLSFLFLFNLFCLFWRFAVSFPSYEIEISQDWFSVYLLPNHWIRRWASRCYSYCETFLFFKGSSKIFFKHRQEEVWSPHVVHASKP